MKIGWRPFPGFSSRNPRPSVLCVYHPVGRIVLPRKAETLETPFGRVQVKTVALPGGEVRYYPEFESCRSLAKSRNVPLMSVYEAVKVAAEHRGNSESDDAKPPLD